MLNTHYIEFCYSFFIILIKVTLYSDELNEEEHQRKYPSIDSENFIQKNLVICKEKNAHKKGNHQKYIHGILNLSSKRYGI